MAASCPEGGISALAVPRETMVRAILEVPAQPSVRALWWGRHGPGAVGSYERADGANDPATSMCSVLRQGNSRARRSRQQSSRFAPRSSAVQAERGGAFCSRGRIPWASYATSSRHIAYRMPARHGCAAAGPERHAAGDSPGGSRLRDVQQSPACRGRQALWRSHAARLLLNDRVAQRTGVDRTTIPRREGAYAGRAARLKPRARQQFVAVTDRDATNPSRRRRGG